MFSIKMVPHRSGKDCAALITWLGLPTHLRGKGYLGLLMREVLGVCLRASRAVPFRYIVLDVAPDAHSGVKKMYSRMGFSETNNATRMAMKISKVKKLFDRS